MYISSKYQLPISLTTHNQYLKTLYQSIDEDNGYQRMITIENSPWT